MIVVILDDIDIPEGFADGNASGENFLWGNTLIDKRLDKFFMGDDIQIEVRILPKLVDGKVCNDPN